MVLFGIGFIFFLVTCVGFIAASPDYSPYHRVCLIEQEAQFRPEEGRFKPSDVTDPSLCTHLVYSHALVNAEDLGLNPAGPYDEENYSSLTSLKSDNLELKIMLAIGGPEGSEGFRGVANDTESVNQFVDNCIQFLHERSFDGVVIDWTPHTIDDDQNDDHLEAFALLMTTLSEMVKLDSVQTGRAELLVTAVISGERDVIESFYPVQALATHADLVLVKTYDLYSPAIPVIGHQSALYPRDGEEGYFTVLNLDFSIQFLLYLQVPSHKLVVGVPSHGSTLRFLNASLQYFGAEHAGPGEAGMYSQRSGKLTYYEICDLLKVGWVESFHESHRVPFAFSDQEITTYDNDQSIQYKVNYVKDNELGGVFLSSLADDDFKGTFCHTDPFPLTRAVRKAFLQSRDDCYPGEYGPVDLPGCAPCPMGSFQPLPHQTECLPCPRGMSTLQKGSEEGKQCVVDCGSGYEYSFLSKSCDICPLGFFRDASTHAHCNQCPVNMTTVAKGSSYCVDEPEGMTKKPSERVAVEATLMFEVDACENEYVIFSVITQTLAKYLLQVSTTWPSLCHPECSNLQLTKQQGCTLLTQRRAKASLEMTARLDNVSLVTEGDQQQRLASKVLEEVLYDVTAYEPLATYGITFKGLTSVDTVIVCEDGFTVQDGGCGACPGGSFHNMTSAMCEKCPLGTYQEAPEMTSCTECEGVKSTVVSGATSPTQCVCMAVALGSIKFILS